MSKIHFPKKNFFTKTDELEKVPKGKILYYISVKPPTDDDEILKLIRNSLESYVKERMVQTNCYSSYENISKYQNLKVNKVEVGEKFNSSGVLKLYLTLNKDVIEDISYIRHNLDVQTYFNGNVKVQIRFCLFFDQEEFLNFSFQ